MLLRRADVLDGAMALLDAVGLDRLTTRRLGASLNLQGTALYRHFASKEALLDAMADRLLAGVGSPLPDGTWEDQLVILANRMHRALLSHRDGARVVAGTYVAGPNTHLIEDAIFDILERSGLSPERAGWVGFALSHYVLGHTIEEQAQVLLAAAGTWAAKLQTITAEITDGFARTAVAATFAADPEERFQFGLRVFLDGIRQQIPAETSRAQRAKRPAQASSDDATAAARAQQ